MNKETRNAIERATQGARKLLEEDFAAQLEGDFDVHRDGTVAANAGGHLTDRQAFQRERIVAAIEHKRAAGMGPADSVVDYLRDAAFTTLNRFVALKMLEARELVQECITKGEQSAGYREFCGMAPGLPLIPDSTGYRLYIESLFDELSTEVKVLFDRRDTSSVLWPKRTTFEQLLEILNATELAGVWGEDETIGWVYQFFNGQDERRKMREESQAPRNSRELAVRNQFFTPRYVVQFLTDNTLGRIWYEMRGTKTALADRCEYMVRKPGEEFAPRAKKDPRDLRVLDPACGSGHFLLYAFDLLLAIYDEAYADAESPKSEATGKTLAEDYPTLDALRKAIPSLLLAHNLHGVDIDPRCAQIAQLALWMRAQKAYRDFSIARAERMQIRRSNIVVAEPLVADEQIAKEFVAKLGDAELGRVFIALVESLQLAGDLGLLLRVEKLIARPAKRGQVGDLFAPPEERIRTTLDRFVREAANATSTRRRLFADDAAHGLALLGVAEKRYDVVLMNPPFGEASGCTQALLSKQWPEWGANILCAFVARATEMSAPDGFVGAIFDRTVNVKSTYEQYRRRWMLSDGFATRLLVELGWNVLDANVEVCASVNSGGEAACLGIDLRLVAASEKAAQLQSSVRDGAKWNIRPVSGIRRLPNAVLSPDFPDYLVRVLGRSPTLGDAGFSAYSGYSLKADQHYRLWWESPCGPARLSTFFRMPMFNGSGFEPFTTSFLESAVSHVPPEQLPPSTTTRVLNTHVRGRPGICFGKRGEFLTAHVLPAGFLFTQEGRPLPVDDRESAIDLLGYLNTTIIRAALNLFAGQHKTSGYVNMLPWEPPPEREGLRALAFAAICRRLRVQVWSETDRLFCPPVMLASETIQSIAMRLIDEIEVSERATEDAERSWQAALEVQFDVTDGDRTHLATLAQQQPTARVASGLSAMTAAAYASMLISWAVGVAFGRFDLRLVTGAQPHPPDPDPFAPLPACSPGMLTGADGLPVASAPSGYPIPIPTDGILVDDSGAEWDVLASVRRVLGVVFREAGDERLAEAVTLLDVRSEDLRLWLRGNFFAEHVQRYSKSRRKAPIYWQLATPSARYSAWLYIHAFSKDTLFRVQNAYVAPKLANEERRLEALTRELQDRSTDAQRKDLADQQAFVEELRTFLDEVKRVAPLWNPDLDDGVIINFAPLWRLVPHHKPWQKELTDTWDALCEGKYDWTHLAMHLWPERVVPKCAKDRSLATAHGLEDVFWVEGTDGKWTARKTPTRSLDELVRERTSPAVKSALKSLLEAPAVTGNAGRGRGGRRKAHAEGGNA